MSNLSQNKSVVPNPAVLLAGVDGEIAMWDVTVKIRVPMDEPDSDEDLDDEEDFSAADDDANLKGFSPELNGAVDIGGTLESTIDDNEEVSETFSVVMSATTMASALTQIETNRDYFLDKLGYDSSQGDTLEVISLCKSEVSLFLIKGREH